MRGDRGLKKEASHENERAELECGLMRLGLAAPAALADRLMQHVALIRRWARSYNLVARGDLGALIGRHVLDSLAIHDHVGPKSLLDVGSGAGFPGLPLAIARPGIEVTLLDSSGKRIRFLRHVVRSLDLENVQVVQARVQDHQAATAPDSIVSRAFSSLAEFAAAVRHLVGPATQVLAVKGRYPREELEKLPGWVTVEAVSQYHVPDLRAERHLVIMRLSPEPAERLT